VRESAFSTILLKDFRQNEPPAVCCEDTCAPSMAWEGTVPDSVVQFGKTPPDKVLLRRLIGQIQRT
jgi:hypothetical protein